MHSRNNRPLTAASSNRIPASPGAGSARVASVTMQSRGRIIGRRLAQKVDRSPDVPDLTEEALDDLNEAV